MQMFLKNKPDFFTCFAEFSSSYALLHRFSCESLYYASSFFSSSLDYCFTSHSLHLISIHKIKNSAEENIPNLNPFFNQISLRFSVGFELFSSILVTAAVDKHSPTFRPHFRKCLGKKLWLKPLLLDPAGHTVL